jgi:hypothetical protein
MWVAIQPIEDSGALYKVLATFYEALRMFREPGNCRRADRNTDWGWGGMKWGHGRECLKPEHDRVERGRERN